MADRMIARLLVAVFGLSCASAGGAQAMRDPTRPPLDLASAVPGAPVAGSPLQSILISSGRKGAIINGQYVPLGGSYGDARLVNVTATDVTLKGPDKSEVLKLVPGDSKTFVASGISPKTSKPGKRQ